MTTDPTPSPSPTPPERIAPLTAEECHTLRLRLPPPFADGTRDRFTVIAEKVYAMELEAIAREAKLNSSSSESVPKISAGVSGRHPMNSLSSLELDINE